MNNIKWIIFQLLKVGFIKIFFSLFFFILIAVLDLVLILFLQFLISGKNIFNFDVQFILYSLPLVIIIRTLVNVFSSSLNMSILKFLYFNLTKIFIEKVFTNGIISVLDFDKKSFKNILTFQISQVVQLLINPFLKIFPDILFLVIFLSYLIYLIPIKLLLIFGFIFLIYLSVLKWLNKRIKINSEVSFEAQNNINFFYENLFNGLKEFILIYKGLEIFNLVHSNSNNYISRLTSNFFYSNFKRILLELMLFINIFLCLILIDNKSDLLLIFGGFLRILPLINNLNLFITNKNNLNPVINELKKFF